MKLQDFVNFTTEALNNTSHSLTNQVPSIVAAIVIFLVGLIVAAILVRVWSEIVKAVNLEKSLETLNTYADLVKANKTLTATNVVSNLVWWVVVVVFAVAALRSLDLKAVDATLARFFDYLPAIISGSLFLVLG